MINHLPVRVEYQKKLYLFYKETLENLYYIIDIGDGLISPLNYFYMDEGLKSAQCFPNGVLFNYEIPYNVAITIREILEDYWAAYLCFRNGFMKQSQEILRNSLELIINIFYIMTLERNKMEEDNWIESNTGVSKIGDKIKAIKKMKLLKPELTSKLNELYDQLCTSTHSHKKRMASLNMPRDYDPIPEIRNSPPLNHFEVCYTKGLFLSLMKLQIESILNYFKSIPNDESEDLLNHVLDIENILTNMLEILNEYQPLIQNFTKGYLIHRRNFQVSPKKQILYSLRIDGREEFPGKSKYVTPEENNKLKELIREHLGRDLK